MKYNIGIDLGGTNIKVGLVDENYNIVAKATCKTDLPRPAEEIADSIAETVWKALNDAKVTIDELNSIGIGTPGTASRDTGVVLYSCNLGFRNTDLRSLIGARLGKQVYVENDANAAAFGEVLAGAGKGCRDVVVVTLGTGVGGGIIINGEIAPSHRGVGGELGHITVNPDEEATCNCGNHGCLEQYASATGVVRIAKKLLAASKEESSLRTLETVTAKDVFDAAKAGDHLAVEAVEVLGKYLGLVVANVALTVDPDVFVIGGGVSKAGQVLIDVITKYYHKFAKIIGDNKAKVVLAKLGNDAGIYGAARMVLK